MEKYSYRFPLLGWVSSLILFFSLPGFAQITPAVNGTNTTVTVNGQQFDIGGGAFSRDGQNLFHLFKQFGLNDGQIANFLSNPGVRNILAGVNGGEVSYINGLIQVMGGNSNLYLLNPAGIVFGPNASLNVPAAFHASTASRVHFDGGVFDLNGFNDYVNLTGNPTGFEFLSTGIIVNEGNLAVGPGQNLTLMGHQVINTGSLSAPGGTITIQAVPETGMVRISQEGMILSIEIPADKIPEDGIIEPADIPELLAGKNPDEAVNSIVYNGDGTISFVYDPNKVNIPLEGATAVVSGTVDVSNLEGLGGQINVLGDNIALINAQLNASGQNGGGTILIGGDYMGGTTGTNRLDSSFNAQNLFVDNNSVLNADAITNGNGGTVINWADNSTVFNGFISARGGEFSGDGGFVEVSGKNYLAFDGQVNTLAPMGNAGLLMLDPQNIEVISTTGTTTSTSIVFTDPPASGTSTIQHSMIDAATSHVLLQATNNITFSAPISMTNAGVNLTAQAGNNIFLNANITTNNGHVSLLAGPASGAPSPISTGGISSTGTFSITTNGSNIELKAASVDLPNVDLITKRSAGNVNATILPSAGNVIVQASSSKIRDINTSITISGFVDNFGDVGNGGTINLTATNGDIQVRDINSSISIASFVDDLILPSGVGSAGMITLTATNGDINVRDINSSLEVGEYITDGSVVGSAGYVQLSATDINVNSINTTLKVGSDSSGRSVLSSRAGSAGNIVVSGESLTLTGNIDSSLTTTGTLPNSSIGNGGNITLSVSNTNLSLSGRTLNAETKINAVTNSTGPIGGTINLISNDSIIVLNSNFTTNRNSIILNSDLDANGGAIRLTNTTLTSNGGNIILGGGADPLTTAAIGTATNKSGIELNNSTLTAGGGNINLMGQGYSSGSDNYGINVRGGDITTTNGNILLTGTGGASTSFSNFGIFVQNGANISSTGTGNLTLVGNGGGSGSSLGNDGIQINNSHLSTGSGAILLEGTGGAGGQSHGIRQITGSSVTSSSGNITYLGDVNNASPSGIWVQFANSSVSPSVNNIIGNTSGTVTLTADRITVNELDIKPGSSTSNLIIQPLNVNTSIAIGDVSLSGNLNLNNTALNFINDGFNLITIGRIDSTGTINISNAAFKDDLLIRTPAGTGTINVNGLLSSLTTNITLNAAQDINVNSGAGIVSGTGNITLDAGRDISFNAISGIVDGTGNILLDAGRNVSFSSFTTGLDWKGNITVIAVNDISFTNAVLGTTKNVSLSAGGNATQAGTSILLANGLDILGAGNFTLNSTTNNISTLAGNSTGSLSFTNANGFDITGLQANQLTLTSGGVLTQSGAITTTGATTLNAGSHDITLIHANNDFTTLGLTAANATIVDQNALELTASTLTGNLSVTTNGTLTQSGAISAQGLAILGTGNTVLDHPNNQIQTLAADTTGSLTVLTTTDLTIDTVNPTGIKNADTVLLQSTGGNITLNEPINAAADITLVADQNFINNVGVTAFTSGGRWLVYATSPAGNVNGWSVLGGSQQFGTTYPTPPGFGGNGFIYTVAAPLVPVQPSQTSAIIATTITPIVTSPGVSPLVTPSQPPAVNNPPPVLTPANLPLPPNFSTVLQGEEEENLPIEKTLCQLVESDDSPLEVDGVPVESALAEQCR